MIEDIKKAENMCNPRECEYSRIVAAILSYYFHVTSNIAWVIAPEYNYGGNVFPDYTIFLYDDDTDPSLIPHIVVEVKSKSGDSWYKLLEQMWGQANHIWYDSESSWAIGVKGLEICIFRFNALKYNDQIPDCFTHFEPLNLEKLSTPALDALNVKYEMCNDNGFARIAVIKWRLDNPDHIPYIDHMFQYMRSKIVQSQSS
jgi:hypothetical protein